MFTLLWCITIATRKVVNLLEQLTKLSKAQVMPGIRPHIEMSEEETSSTEQEQNWENRWGSLNQFFLWVSWEVWDHLQIKWTSSDPWWGQSRIRRRAKYIFLIDSRSASAPQMLNCWLWVSVHVVHRESSPVLLVNALVILCAKLLPSYKNNTPTH